MTIRVFFYLLTQLLLITSKIDKINRRFIDNHNRTRIYHGVNMVVKIPPYLPTNDSFHPFTSLVEEDFTHLKKLGFNMVRLGILWEALETSENYYNTTYLEKIVEIINQFGKHDIAVMLDAHQDLFSRILCGEGVPYFYANKLNHDKDCSKSIIENFLHYIGVCYPFKEYNIPLDENQVPKISDCKKHSFIDYHTSPDLTSLYAKFYANENGIIDKYIKFWEQFVARLKGNPYIFGYDIWNEPWPGNMWFDYKYLIPGKSDKEQVLPFYKKMNEHLRKIDNDFVFIFQSIPFPDVLPLLGGHLLAGFDETPSGEDYLDKQILNYHSYCCQAAREMCESGEPELASSNTTCRSFHFRKLKKIDEQSKDLKVPFILSEFGACKDTEACYNEIEGLTDACDSFLASWTYWQYKPFGDFTTTCDNEEGIFNSDGSYQMNKVRGLSRTYTQAFQGIPISMNFQAKSSIFKSEFFLDTRITEPTVVYYNPELYYKNGIKIKIFDINLLEEKYHVSVNQTFDLNRFSILFKNKENSKSINEDIIVSFSVTPKAYYEMEVNNSTDLPESVTNLVNVEIIENLKNNSNYIEFSKEVTSKVLNENFEIKTFHDSVENSLNCGFGQKCNLKRKIIQKIHFKIKYPSYEINFKINYLVSNIISLKIK